MGLNNNDLQELDMQKGGKRNQEKEFYLMVEKSSGCETIAAAVGVAAAIRPAQPPPLLGAIEKGSHRVGTLAPPLTRTGGTTTVIGFQNRRRVLHRR
jgi:hypothetical protein